MNHRGGGPSNQSNLEAHQWGEPPRGGFDTNSGMPAGCGGRGGFERSSGMVAGPPSGTEITSEPPIGHVRGGRGGFDSSTGISAGRGGIYFGSSGTLSADRGGFDTSFGLFSGPGGTEITSGISVGRGRGGFDTSSTSSQISACRGGRGRGGRGRFKIVTGISADSTSGLPYGTEITLGTPVGRGCGERGGFDTSFGVPAGLGSTGITSGTSVGRGRGGFDTSSQISDSRGGFDIGSGPSSGRGGYGGIDTSFEGIPPDHAERQLTEGIASGFAQQTIQNLPHPECGSAIANFMRQVGKHFEEIANKIEK